MKIIFFSLVVSFMVSFVASASFAAGESFAPLDCYKAAMADPAVLKTSKSFDRTGLNAYSEEYAVNLCAGGVAPASRVACYKAAMTDPAVLTLHKSFDRGSSGASYSQSLSAYSEGLSAILCGGTAVGYTR